MEEDGGMIKARTYSREDGGMIKTRTDSREDGGMMEGWKYVQKEDGRRRRGG